MSRMLTLKEVSEKLNLHINTVRNFVDQGLITRVKMGKAVRIDEKDLNEFIRTRKQRLKDEEGRRDRLREAGKKRREGMRKIYNCFSCGKWFSEAKVVDHGQWGKVELCPFCEKKVYQARGLKAALVCLWWRLKEL